jgi:hypothetical protein
MKLRAIGVFGLVYAANPISGLCHDVSVHAKITTAAVNGATNFDNYL